MERWQQIESLFQEALRRPVGERDSWLREACATDTELHREVASLVANHHASASAGPWAAAAAQLTVKPALLEAGQHIGPYQIVSFVAAGGMGEVYRARDTKLKRDVALKVLPEAFARDPGRMMRFQREAEVPASLNHPNIAHIYGVEERALVMELVEGESPKGPMPVDETWKIAEQIADALEYAHARGVVHRDLKPSNIKVTPDGVVKLLDFGLAKAYSPSPDTVGANPADSPTMTLGATVPGVILGTAAYMSPEQVRGKSVDQRADIWAFGVVLYELLTAKQLFRGDDLAETLASVVKEQPDLRAVPKRLRKVLKACLEKDPKQRLRSIGDLHYLLEAEPAAAKHPWPTAVMASVAAVLLVALGIGFLFYVRRQPAERPVVRFQIPAPEEKVSINKFVALSPDGHRLALTLTGEDGGTSLWIRALDSLEMRKLPGTEGASPAAMPFWSPDARFIGFFAGGKLKKIDLSGAPAQTLCGAEDGFGGAWNRDGVIIFMRARSGIWRVPEAGGAASQIIAVIPPDEADSPSFLPDGHHFLYGIIRTFEANGAWFVATLDGSEKKRVFGGARYTAYAPPSVAGEEGHLLFLREGSILMAQPFNEKSLESTGEAFPVAENVGSFSASVNGALAYRNFTSVFNRMQLAWFDRTGKLLAKAGPPGRYSSLTLSADGSRVALTRQGDSGNPDIWIQDLHRDIPTRFTFDASTDWEPVWSPDGKRLAFASRRDRGIDQIYWKDSSGVGNEEAVWNSAEGQRPEAWSPDGKFLLFMRQSENGSAHNLWTLPVDPGTPRAERNAAPYFTSPSDITQGQISPGPATAPRWVAYTSNESGQSQIWVQSFPAGTGKFQVSTSGGVQPRWRRDDKELFYLSLEGKLMAVEVKTAPTFEYGIPKELFPTQILRAAGFPLVFQYDVAPEGNRFLVLNNAVSEGSNSSPITVVLNWTAGLKAAR